MAAPAPRAQNRAELAHRIPVAASPRKFRFLTEESYEENRQLVRRDEENPGQLGGMREMGKLTSQRKRLVFVVAGGALLVLGIALGTGITAIVNAHGGDTGKVHACRTPSGQIRLVGPDNDCSTLPAQWQNPIDLDDDWSGAGSGSMFPSSLTDNVGIGTTTPQAKLHVSGGPIALGVRGNVFSDGRLGLGTDDYVGFFLGSAVAGFTEPAFDDDAFMFVNGFTGTEESDLRLYVLDNDDDQFSIWGGSCAGGDCEDINAASMAHAFRADGNTFHKGNVGIGTTTPEAKLHVSGGTILVDLGTAPTTPIALDVRGGHALVERRVGLGSNEFDTARIRGLTEPAEASDLFQFVGGFTGVEDSDLRLYVLDNDEDQFSIWGGSCSGGDCGNINAASMAHAFRADGNTFHKGNVGIGTTAPEARLHVSGGSILLDGSLRAKDTFGNSIDILHIGDAHFVDNFTKIGSGGAGITFLNSDGTDEKLTILDSGEVGVGTVTPQSALHVSGYTQLDLTSGAPPSADCDDASERGRMKVDSAAGLLYVCVDSGWLGK